MGPREDGTIPNLNIEYDPLTNEFLNSANNQPVTPDDTDSVTIVADPGGAWAGGYVMTLPGNFTCKSLTIVDGVRAIEPSGGTLTGDVFVGGGAGTGFTSILQLGTDGSAPTTLTGSIQMGAALGQGALLSTHGPVSIQGPPGSVCSVGDLAEIDVIDGQLDIHTAFQLLGTREIAVSSGATLNMVTGLTADQISRIIAGMQLATVGGIVDSGPLLINGSIPDAGGSVDLDPPVTASGASSVPVILGPTGGLQGGTVNFGANVSYQSGTLDDVTATGEMDVGAGQSVTIQNSFTGPVSVNVTGLLFNINNITDLTTPVFTIGAADAGSTVDAQVQGSGSGLALGQITFTGNTNWTDGTASSNLLLQGPVTLLSGSAP